MSDQSTTTRRAFGDIAPALADYTDKVLFGDVWQRPGLSPRDRSLITVASLIALYRVNELAFHLEKALDNGLGRDELIEAITHLAFYAGWPTAATALPIARRVFELARRDRHDHGDPRRDPETERRAVTQIPIPGEVAACAQP